MEPISMVVGTVIGLLSAAGGFGLGRVRRRRESDVERPICTCEHGLAFHDPKTRQCHGTVKGRPLRYSEFLSRPIEWTKEPCACRQYVGVVPADRMLADFSVRSDTDHHAARTRIDLRTPLWNPSVS